MASLGLAEIESRLRGWMHSRPKRRWFRVEETGGPAILKDGLAWVSRAWNEPDQNHGYWFSPVGMDLLASWFGARGVLAIIDQDSEGWRWLRTGLLYRHWRQRLVTYLYDMDRRANKPNREYVNPVALTLAHAIATNDTTVVEWTGTRMLQAIDDGSLGAWSANPFEPFLAKLFASSQGRLLNYSGHLIAGMPVCDLGVYAGIIDHWESPAGLAHSLEQACEYRMSRTDDSAADEIHEFALYPYPIFPVEIMAVLEIRRSMGLAVPALRHPLMHTPLAEPPRELPEVNDEWLNRIIGRARKEYSRI